LSLIKNQCLGVVKIVKEAPPTGEKTGGFFVKKGLRNFAEGRTHGLANVHIEPNRTELILAEWAMRGNMTKTHNHVRQVQLMTLVQVAKMERRKNYTWRCSVLHTERLLVHGEGKSFKDLQFVCSWRKEGVKSKKHQSRKGKLT